MYKRILVPTDGSQASDRAVHAAIALAGAFGSELYTVSVRESLPPSIAMTEAPMFAHSELLQEAQRKAEVHIDAVRNACSAAGLHCEAYIVDAVHPWEAIVEQATRHAADLIVMASHGHVGLGGLIRGSETPKVLSHTQRSVLIVR